MLEAAIEQALQRLDIRRRLVHGLDAIRYRVTSQPTSGLTRVVAGVHRRESWQ